MNGNVMSLDYTKKRFKHLDRPIENSVDQRLPTVISLHFAITFKFIITRFNLNSRLRYIFKFLVK